MAYQGTGISVDVGHGANDVLVKGYDGKLRWMPKADALAMGFAGPAGNGAAAAAPATFGYAPTAAEDTKPIADIGNAGDAATKEPKATANKSTSAATESDIKAHEAKMAIQGILNGADIPNASAQPTARRKYGTGSKG